MINESRRDSDEKTRHRPGRADERVHKRVQGWWEGVIIIGKADNRELWCKLGKHKTIAGKHKSVLLLLDT